MVGETTNEWDVEETEEKYEDEQSPRLEFEILNYPADTTLKGYLQQRQDGVLEVPKFQRQFVWDQVKASKLIESFLIGLPVPGVFLYKPRVGSTYQVIDGHQRITAVTSFLSGLIGEAKFRLKGVAPEWNGKSFSDLSDDERFKLEQSVMRATIIQQLDPQDDRSIYMIFERLNTGGVNLNPMEVRRYVFSGDFINGLDDLNQLPEWRKCIAKEKQDKRFRDSELILRILALHSNWVNYEKPMKGFLSNHLADNKKNEIPIDIVEKFKNACKTVIETLGEKPFHLRGRLNYGALDSVIVALMATESRPDATKYRKLFGNQSYLNAISSNTSDRAEIHLRISEAIKTFGE